MVVVGGKEEDGDQTMDPALYVSWPWAVQAFCMTNAETSSVDQREWWGGVWSTGELRGVARSV